ncbi:hypothetical protein NPIL_185031 [Nephila pilipes]|uniref:Uncharacterized protein n=1 Tax=Nephila pilipes TaxID=299642 RepID=A0A8X6Q8A3_NEPPI|nr:hypothetical protein NPIL_185031 [Nephila pilipes]
MKKNFCFFSNQRSIAPAKSTLPTKSKNRVNTCSSTKKEKTLPPTVKSIGVRNGIDLQTRGDPPQKKGKKNVSCMGKEPFTSTLTSCEV